jgi:alpha-glucosidase
MDFLGTIIKAVWLSPIYKSPMKDFGYDISDFKDIDPIFGTLEDFKSLLATAHDMGWKIVRKLFENCSKIVRKLFFTLC